MTLWDQARELEPPWWLRRYLRSYIDAGLLRDYIAAPRLSSFNSRQRM